MDEMRSWILTLITITVLSSIIESFAPKGNLNKYIKLICGLAVTTVIAMPVLQIINKDFKMDSIAWGQYMKISEGDFKKRVERMERDDAQRMVEVYRSSMINDIKARFIGYEDFDLTEADVLLYEGTNKEQIGMIRCIYLTLEPKKNNRNKTIDNATLNYVKAELRETFKINDDQIIMDLSKFTGGE